MNRKYNPWVSLVALLLAILILVLTCTGCAVEASAAQELRFTVEFSGMSEGQNIYVVTDTTTGQQYLFVDGYNCGGLCKLEG